MKIYTRTGDQGTTALFGGGRVTKGHPRIRAYGTVDEANSFIGLARASVSETPASDKIHEYLQSVQHELFILGADLATPADSKARIPRIEEDHVVHLERAIDEMEKDLSPLKNFILPGGSPAAASLHVARTVCRRAERNVLEATETEEISPLALIYLNRLSDFLFVMARWVNHNEGVSESAWNRET